MAGEVATSPIRPQQMQGNLAQQADAENGQQLNVEDGQTPEPQYSAKSAPSFWDPSNKYATVRFESSNLTNAVRKVNPNNDEFTWTAESIAPDVLQKQVTENTETVKAAVLSDIGALELTVNGEQLEVPSMSLRQIRLNQDKYPDFMVLGMPNPGTGRFNLHVTDRATGYALNQEQLIMFIQNVVQPALTPQEDRGVTEVTQ